MKFEHDGRPCFDSHGGPLFQCLGSRVNSLIHVDRIRNCHRANFRVISWVEHVQILGRGRRMESSVDVVVHDRHRLLILCVVVACTDGSLSGEADGKLLCETGGRCGGQVVKQRTVLAGSDLPVSRRGKKIVT